MNKDLSQAIAREFLLVHGLKKSLQVFDEESAFNKDSSSITGLQQLISVVCFHSNVSTKNTKCESILEALVHYVIVKAELNIPTPRTPAQPTGRKEDTLVIDEDIESETIVGDGKAGLLGKFQSKPPTSHGVIVPKSKTRGQAAPVLSSQDKSDRQRFLHWKRGMPLNDPLVKDSKQEQSSSKETMNGKQSDAKAQAKHENKKDASSKVRTAGSANVRHGLHSARKKSQEKEVLVPEESESSMSMLFNNKGQQSARELHQLVSADESTDDVLSLISPPPDISNITSELLTLKTAKKLRQLLFNSCTKSFPASWKYQSFTFRETRQLQYGFIQHKPGPSGILAAVQGYLLKHLLYVNNEKPSISKLSPTPKIRQSCLIQALASILWKAGEDKSATIALPGVGQVFNCDEKFPADNLIETLRVYTAPSYQDLMSFISSYLYQFELDGNNGVVLLVYSVMLSRGLDKIENDESKPPLVTSSGSCSQSLMNLLSCGYASPSVDSNPLVKSGGDTDQTRNEIGFLQLQEHYRKKTCTVGSHLKTPLYPIWLLSCDGHYSVAFALNTQLLNNWRAERMFDMFIYDSLCQPDKELRLTIYCSNRARAKSSVEEDTVSPVEHCLRTKWSEAEIDWNGASPLFLPNDSEL